MAAVALCRVPLTTAALSLLIACSQAAGDNGASGPGSGGQGGGAGGAVGSASGGAAGMASGGVASGGVSTGGGSGGGQAPSGGGGADGTGGASGRGFSCPPSPAPGLPFDPDPDIGTVEGVPPDDGFPQGLHILEDALWIDGSLYVSQISGSSTASAGPPGRILRITGDEVEVWAGPETGFAGLALHPDGLLLGARHLDGSIATLEPSDPTALTPLATGFMDARFNSPNGIAVRDDGNVYFADPAYLAPTGPNPQTEMRVYRVAPSGDVTVVDDGRVNPNGVTLSLDQNTLYVSGTDGVMGYPLDESGAAGTGVALPGSLQNGDGMIVDCAGNLYVSTGQEVAVLAPGDSTELGRISIDEPGITIVTSVALGGTPQDPRLFITTMGSQPRLFFVDLSF